VISFGCTVIPSVVVLLSWDGASTAFSTPGS
jgi:hypothetical protein